MQAQARLLLLATMILSFAAMGPVAVADTSAGGFAPSVAPLKKAKHKPPPHTTNIEGQQTSHKIETPLVGGTKKKKKNNLNSWQIGH
jgi:hypothetical protein